MNTLQAYDRYDSYNKEFAPLDQTVKMNALFLYRAENKEGVTKSNISVTKDGRLYQMNAIEKGWQSVKNFFTKNRSQEKLEERVDQAITSTANDIKLHLEKLSEFIEKKEPTTLSNEQKAALSWMGDISYRRFYDAPKMELLLPTPVSKLQLEKFTIQKLTPKTTDIRPTLDRIHELAQIIHKVAPPKTA